MTMQQEKLSSPNWTDRYTAINTMFLLVEDCSKQFRKDLVTFCDTLRPFLFDEVPIVQRRACYFYIEVYDNISGKALSDSAPWLIQDIAKLINSPNPFFIESGLLLFETICISYGKKHQGEMIAILVFY